MKNKYNQEFIWHIDELERQRHNLTPNSEVYTAAVAVGVVVAMVSLAVWLVTK